MRKPLSITSPNHGMAITVYFMLGLTGLVFILSDGGTGVMELITKQFNAGLAQIWGTMLMISSWSCLGAAASVKRARIPERNLDVEMYATLGLAINLLFLYGCIVAQLGPSGTFSGFSALAFGVGAIYRAVQIWLDQRKLKKARANPVESEPVLADPRDEFEK